MAELFYRISRWVCFGLCLTGYVIVQGQSLSIETKMDTNRITLGDQVGIKYDIIKEEHILLKLPKFRDTLIRGVELIRPPQIDSAGIKDNRQRITIDLLVTAFDTGLYYIPPQPFAFQDGLFTDTAFSRASYLLVSGVPLDSTFMVRDIKAPASDPFPVWLTVLYVLIALIVVAGLSYLIWWAHVRANPELQHRAVVRKKPGEPPYVIALRELDRIKAQKLWQKDEVKEYYTGITHIIRWFISKSFNVKALEETSGEILEHLKALDLDEVNYSHLERLLNLADLVKFAKGKPNPEENLEHLDNAYSFVKTVRNAMLQAEKNESTNSKPDTEE